MALWVGCCDWKDAEEQLPTADSGPGPSYSKCHLSSSRRAVKATEKLPELSWLGLRILWVLKVKKEIIIILKKKRKPTWGIYLIMTSISNWWHWQPHTDTANMELYCKRVCEEIGWNLHADACKYLYFFGGDHFGELWPTFFPWVVVANLVPPWLEAHRESCPEPTLCCMLGRDTSFLQRPGPESTLLEVTLWLGTAVKHSWPQENKRVSWYHPDRTDRKLLETLDFCYSLGQHWF